MIKDRLLSTIPLSTLSGVGPRLVNKFARLGLKNIQDLLLHLPARYENRTKIYSIDEVLPGMIVTVCGEIIKNDVSLSHKRIMLICRLRDHSGILTLRFFNFNNTIKNQLSPGRLIIAYGEIRFGKNGNEIIHPEYQIINNPCSKKTCANLTPIYPTTNGIKQTTLRRIISQALKLLDIIPVIELIPSELNKGLMSLTDALKILHRPPSAIKPNDLALYRHPAQQRLILEELLAYNLCMLALKSEMQKDRALPIHADNVLFQRLVTSLPFTLTKAQWRVIKEITNDLALNVPMMRLVQGDVGSGKTIIAALAALCAIGNGWQVALMAPTELLAEQHLQNLREWFTPLGIEVGYLTGKQKGKARQMQQDAISNGRVSMIVGTHAIFQEQVNFAGLALVIIDEQHRFGVHQRLALWEKGFKQDFHPHQLIMTATPIPRTLAMTVYANLDASIIDELPPGRTPVTTVVIPNTRRDEIIRHVYHACLKERRQAYWVCTMIKKSNVLEAQAAETIWQELKSTLPNLRIGLMHGRMKTIEKQQLMQAFKAGDLQLLVATTVIEVGVDVPNASLMIIENSERLGLAQLHQLRGRIGRGAITSHCVLLYKSPLSKISQSRLKVLRDNNDGFIIAQRDLEIRGPGELLGTRQTGSIKFRIADLLRDHSIIPEVQNLARHIHRYHPDFAQALIKRWMPEQLYYNCV